MNSGIRKILRITWKILASLTLIFLLAVFATDFSPIYNFSKPQPFSGPDIFNPYSQFDTLSTWKRANFHTHTRVKGIFNECRYTPAETDKAYRKLGYDIVTFSNHNELTRHPYDSTLQVNVYEHGYNLFKYHKLVFGSKDVDRYDNLIPLIASQKQYQLDRLGESSDFIQMNHPPRTIGTSKDLMEKLGGYNIMELDAGKTTDNKFWDWALSAGHYSFGLANDDLHYPDRTRKIAVRSNFLMTPSARYDDLKNTLLTGCYYSMRIPDYGRGDWEKKYAGNRNLPYITDIGLKGNDTIYISFSQKADSIRVTGQDHLTLAFDTSSDSLQYIFSPADTYARITAYFPGGEVIYTNPFARYDSSISPTPYSDPQHSVNLLLTILYNLLFAVLCLGDIFLLYRIMCSRRSKK